MPPACGFFVLSVIPTLFTKAVLSVKIGETQGRGGTGLKKETLLKLLPLAAMLLMLVFFGTALRGVSLDDILSLAPDSYALCALLLVGLYALKSLTILFPVLVLYISSGLLLPLPLALLTNTVGLLVCASLPYAIGRFSGRDAVARLTARYPKAARLSDYSSENALLFTYLLRVVNLFPGDLVSMVLGAADTPYVRFVAGSMLGLLPVMIPATIMGRNLDDPFSLPFILSFTAIAVVSLLSTLLLRRYEKRNRGAHSTGIK